MPVHHVRKEELPPCALPQLEARSDGGTLYVCHPTENLWDLHRARGLLLVGSARKITGSTSAVTVCFQENVFLFAHHFTEEGFANSLSLP